MHLYCCTNLQSKNRQLSPHQTKIVMQQYDYMSADCYRTLPWSILIGSHTRPFFMLRAVLNQVALSTWRSFEVTSRHFEHFIVAHIHWCTWLVKFIERHFVYRLSAFRSTCCDKLHFMPSDVVDETCHEVFYSFTFTVRWPESLCNRMSNMQLMKGANLMSVTVSLHGDGARAGHTPSCRERGYDLTRIWTI